MTKKYDIYVLNFRVAKDFRAADFVLMDIFINFPRLTKWNVIKLNVF